MSDVSSWMQKLNDNFSYAGTVGGILLTVIDEENRYKEKCIEKWQGANSLSEAFQGFFLGTLNIVEEKRLAYSYDADFNVVIAFFWVLFKKVRASEILFMHGYSCDAFALLRPLSEHVAYTHSVVSGRNKIEDFISLSLNKTDNKENYERYQKAMKNMNESINKFFVDEFTEIEKYQLVKWRNFFHSEIHGYTLSFCHQMEDMYYEKSDLKKLHKLQDKDILFLNRSLEVYWMLMKMLPYLQYEPFIFGTEWLNRYKILDQCFKENENALAEIGKDIAAVIVSLIDKKFNFPDEFCYTWKNKQ